MELVWRDGSAATPQLRAAMAARWTPERPHGLRLLRSVFARTGDGSLHVTARIQPTDRRGEAWELVLEYPAGESFGVEAAAEPGQAEYWAMLFAVHVEEWWATRSCNVVRGATVIR
jgi:hypothetical protein